MGSPARDFVAGAPGGVPGAAAPAAAARRHDARALRDEASGYAPAPPPDPAPGELDALAFATDPHSERALREGLAGLPDAQVWPGDLRAAAAALAQGHAPRIVFVDIDDIAYPAGALYELSTVCEVGTIVIALGSATRRGSAAKFSSPGSATTWSNPFRWRQCASPSRAPPVPSPTVPWRAGWWDSREPAVAARRRSLPPPPCSRPSAGGTSRCSTSTARSPPSRSCSTSSPGVGSSTCSARWPGPRCTRRWSRACARNVRTGSRSTATPGAGSRRRSRRCGRCASCWWSCSAGRTW